jgi:hypothetical protein
MDAKEIEVMKEAARRLEAFFGERGMKVQHSVALEALTASLGARNWRTLRDKLSESDIVEERVIVPEDVEPSVRFLVRGVRTDDEEPFAKFFEAPNARCAGFKAIALTWYQHEDALEVTEVVDRVSGETTRFDAFSSVEFVEHAEAFRSVLQTAQACLPSEADVTVRKMDEWKSDVALLEFFAKALESEPFCNALNLVLDERPGLIGEMDGILGLEGSNGTFITSSPEDLFEYLITVLKEYEARFPREALDALWQVYALYEVAQRSVAAVYAYDAVYGY